MKNRVIDLDESEVRELWPIPFIDSGFWAFTMEACLLTGELEKAVRSVFATFPKVIQHALTFSPESGGWANRARFWQTVLKLTLPPRQYYTSINKIIRWYVHCVRDVQWSHKYCLSDKQIYEKDVSHYLCECFRKGAAGEFRPFAEDFGAEVREMSAQTGMPLKQLEDTQGLKSIFVLGNKAYEQGAKWRSALHERRLPG